MYPHLMQSSHSAIYQEYADHAAMPSPASLAVIFASRKLFIWLYHIQVANQHNFNVDRRMNKPGGLFIAVRSISARLTDHY